jgi:hypothetical protein
LCNVSISFKCGGIRPSYHLGEGRKHVLKS